MMLVLLLLMYLCELNKLSEHIRTSNFYCFRKNVKLLLFTHHYKNFVCIVHIIVISVLITVNYCKCILLFSPLNSHLSYTLDIGLKYILLLF